MKPQDNWRDEVKDFAEFVLRENSFDDAANFLSYHFSRGGSWKPVAGLLLRLMAQARFRQAHKVSYLLDEFLPMCPDFVVRKLKKQEERMYLRLNHLWGYQKCMLNQLVSCPEGRAFLQRAKGR